MTAPCEAVRWAIVPDAEGGGPQENHCGCGARDPFEADTLWTGGELSELEERLEAEYVLGFLPMLCVWYTCPDVCPPGG